MEGREAPDRQEKPALGGWGPVKEQLLEPTRERQEVTDTRLWPGLSSPDRRNAVHFGAEMKDSWGAS
jgi:hypothetical protein